MPQYYTFFCQGIQSNDQKPNVILILVDDLKPNLGVYGDDFSKKSKH